GSMVTRKWDPGTINEEWIGVSLYRIKGGMYLGTRSRSDQRCMGMEIKGVYMERIRKIGFIGEQDLISIILKMKSNVFKGNIGIGTAEICCLLETIFWIFCFIEKIRYEIQWCFVVEFQNGNHGFDIIKEYLPNIRKEVVPEETREEGEIMSTEEETLAPASKEFQIALAETQANGLEMISDPVDREEGLQQIQSLVVKDRTSDRVSEGDEEDVMEMDEFQAALLEHGLDEQTIDALPAVSEEELKEIMAGYEEDDQLQEAGEQNNERNKDTIEQAQKQGTRKRLFKSSVIVAGSTKMRNAVALVSPRKRAAARMGTRKGDTNKQLESKGSSNLNSGNLKI
ncbi:LOW QUALITY PROTEIN: hypothetical protein HID58_028721, partial [Brassica napus]